MFAQKLMKTVVGLAFLASVVSLGACAADKAPVEGELEISGLSDSFDDSKADSATSVLVTGTFSFGQYRSVAYSAKPKYRALKFTAAAGTHVDIRVGSSTGDAVAWILDSQLKTLAFNDDAHAETTDARIQFMIPPGKGTTFYIAFRDYDMISATFSVGLNGGQAVGSGPACGGIQATMCGSGLTCIDDTSDDCNPALGGRDCRGVCVAE
jgi:ethanolamine utilization microcompartment shell protein EutL